MKVSRTISALLLGGLAFSPSVVAAQSPGDQSAEILKELRQIRQLLERLAAPLGTGGVPTAPAESKVKLAAPLTGFALGKSDAPLTMIEFTDLQCPFCRQFHTTTFEQLKKEYIDTGKLRYISRDFPLISLHPLALAAAKAARCASDQRKFWEMRHSILINNPQLVPTSFDTFADQLGLDMTAFKACEADSARFQAELQKDQIDGTAAGVSGTPTFIIGRASATELDGVRVVGAQPYSVLNEKLHSLLAQVSGH
jgi:protein-disulfide isomerase